MRCLVICRDDVKIRSRENVLVPNIAITENVFKKDKCIISSFAILVRWRWRYGIYFNITQFVFFFCVRLPFPWEIVALRVHMAAIGMMQNRKGKDEEKSYSFHVNSFNFYPYICIWCCCYAVMCTWMAYLPLHCVRRTFSAVTNVIAARSPIYFTAAKAYGKHILRQFLCSNGSLSLNAKKKKFRNN